MRPLRRFDKFAATSAAVEHMISDAGWRSRSILDVIPWAFGQAQNSDAAKGQSQLADRVLVTGGAGYIGSVVTSQLLAKGCDVFVYDNLSHGSRRAIPSGAKFVNGDTGDRGALDGIFREQRFDAVVHLAASIEA